MPQAIQKRPLPYDMKKVSIRVADLTMAHKPIVRKTSTSIREYKNNDSDEEEQAPPVEKTATATYKEGTGLPIEDNGAVAVANPEAIWLSIEDDGAEQFPAEETAPPIEDNGAVAVPNPEVTALFIEDDGAVQFPEEDTAPPIENNGAVAVPNPEAAGPHIEDDGA